MSNCEYPDFLGQTDKDGIETSLANISAALIKKRVQFLFGAGMSRDCGAPTGKDLSKKLLDIFFPDTSDNRPSEADLDQLIQDNPLEIIAQAVEGQPGKGRTALTEKLKPFFVNSDLQPAEQHRLFQSLLVLSGRPSINHIYTTNFDDILEKNFGPELSISVTESNANEIEDARDKDIVAVIHLHGKLDGDYKITEKDIYFNQGGVLEDKFRYDLYNTDAFVFVGYSMTDPDIRSLFMNYLEEFRKRNTTHKSTYFVSPTDSLSYRLGKGVWEQREKSVWIPLDALTFFSMLKEHVDRYFLNDVKQNVMDKFNIQDNSAFNDLVDKTAEIIRAKKDDALMLLYEARSVGGGR